MRLDDVVNRRGVRVPLPPHFTAPLSFAARLRYAHRPPSGTAGAEECVCVCVHVCGCVCVCARWCGVGLCLLVFSYSNGIFPNDPIFLTIPKPPASKMGIR